MGCTLVKLEPELPRRPDPVARSFGVRPLQRTEPGRSLRLVGALKRGDRYAETQRAAPKRSHDPVLPPSPRPNGPGHRTDGDDSDALQSVLPTCPSHPTRE